MTELERRALMGDRQAQAECTRRGVLLPCPFCGGEAILGNNKRESRKRYGVYHIEASVQCTKCTAKITMSGPDAETAYKYAGKRWNTRHAPPVGRCKDCRYFGGVCDGQGSCSCGKIEVQDGAGVYPFDNDYCSYFEPKEKECKA